MGDAVTDTALASLQEKLAALGAHSQPPVTGQGQWQVAPERLVKVHVPPTLTGVLQARLDALPREEKTALQQAAVVGHVFWDEALAAIHVPSKAALPALARRELVFGRETTAVDEAGEYVLSITSCIR